MKGWPTKKIALQGTSTTTLQELQVVVHWVHDIHGWCTNSKIFAGIFFFLGMVAGLYWNNHNI